MEITKDKNGIDQVVLRNPRGASVRVSLHGGQVLSWRNERGEELLFCGASLSKGALKLFTSPKQIEGGIPICFPEFETCDTVEKNGFARKRTWIIDDNAPPLHSKDSEENTFVDLLLKPSERELWGSWPHRFEFRMRVSITVDGKLSLISRVKNTDKKSFFFSFVYQSFLAVSDVGEVRVEGMETLHYVDNLQEKECFTEQGNAISFDSQVSRTYLRAPKVIAVLDHCKRRTFLIKKEGLPDIVVWNPWDMTPKNKLDFSPVELKPGVCVNAAAVQPIKLRSGDEWKGSVEFMVVPSSLNCDGLFP